MPVSECDKMGMTGDSVERSLTGESHDEAEVSVEAGGTSSSGDTGSDTAAKSLDQTDHTEQTDGGDQTDDDVDQKANSTCRRSSDNPIAEKPKIFIQDNIHYSEKVVFKERVIEVPEVQVVEKVIEVPRKVYKERVQLQNVTVWEDKVVQVPKPVYVDKIVEVPQVEYKDVPYEKIVEVPEVRTEVIIKEVSVPMPIDVPIIQPRQVPIERTIDRNIPKPVDIITRQKFTMPQLKTKYKEVRVPIYVPRYIEVPIPGNFISADGVVVDVDGVQPPVAGYQCDSTDTNVQQQAIFQSILGRPPTYPVDPTFMQMGCTTQSGATLSKTADDFSVSKLSRQPSERSVRCATIGQSGPHQMSTTSLSHQTVEAA